MVNEFCLANNGFNVPKSQIIINALYPQDPVVQKAISLTRISGNFVDKIIKMYVDIFENFCSDIIQIMKCFALESFNLTCQAEHTKINSRLNFNPGLALIAF